MTDNLCPTKIFFDMDGVLVNFSLGAANGIQKVIDIGDQSLSTFRKLISYDAPDREEPITVDYLDKLMAIKDAKEERTPWMKLVGRTIFGVVGKGGRKYWASLPPNPSFHSMIDTAIELVGLENVYICTAPVTDKTGGCEAGKRDWVANHTSILPENVYVTPDKGSILLKFPDSSNILIDDRTKYCDKWEDAGGIAIQHVQPATVQRVHETISQLNLIVKSQRL